MSEEQQEQTFSTTLLLPLLKKHKFKGKVLIKSTVLQSLHKIFALIAVVQPRRRERTRCAAAITSIMKM